MDGKWIDFLFKLDTGKTKVWSVLAKRDGTLLGYIRWFGRWRGYAFYPEPDMVFEQDCLRDIAAFTESQTKAHRSKPK